MTVHHRTTGIAGALGGAAASWPSGRAQRPAMPLVGFFTVERLLSCTTA